MVFPSLFFETILTYPPPKSNQRLYILYTFGKCFASKVDDEKTTLNELSQVFLDEKSNSFYNVYRLFQRKERVDYAN